MGKTQLNYKYQSAIKTEQFAKKYTLIYENKIKQQKTILKQF